MRFDVPLAPLTSFAAGGSAEKLITCDTSEASQNALREASGGPLWVLGYGANLLVADSGLPGTTVLLRTKQISREDVTLVADAGVWWDDLVQYAIREQLWGLELMSAIPGGVGAAVVGNIAAYGQAIADTLTWVEVFDRETNGSRRLSSSELRFGYRFSAFQEADFSHFIILRAAFSSTHSPSKNLEYQTALDVAEEKGYEPINTLDGRRSTILDTGQSAGTLLDYRSPTRHTSTRLVSFSEYDRL